MRNRRTIIADARNNTLSQIKLRKPQLSTGSCGLAYVFYALCSFLCGDIVSAMAQGDAEEGARAIRHHCLSCHSLEPGRHMTGPSLAGIIGRRAGSLDDFDRYSEAMATSDVVWSEATLDAFLANPQKLIPGNAMTALVGDAKMRADIVAYLAATQGPKGARRTDLPIPYEQKLDLKSLGAASRISKITLCRDTYSVTLENGVTQKHWERNLRFKTDSSEEGPPSGTPVIIPSGRLGDRFYVIFATPAEISRAIETACEE